MPDLIPWGAKELSKLKGDMDRLFEALFEDFGLPRAKYSRGDVQVSGDGGEWVITWPLPGFEPEDVAVTVTGRVLSIVAARKEREGAGLVRLSRELTLPFPIDAALADLEGGVLTVRLTRQAPPAAREIPVARGRSLAECTPSTNQTPRIGTAVTDRREP
jgi:HSP20 family protein